MWRQSHKLEQITKWRGAKFGHVIQRVFYMYESVQNEQQLIFNILYNSLLSGRFI